MRATCLSARFLVSFSLLYMIGNVMLAFFTRRVLSCLLASIPLQSIAAIVEETFEVPTQVQSSDGRLVSQPIVVTVYHDDQAIQHPYLVLNHGRAVSPADFAKMGRVRYSTVSRYFVSLGFVVLVPTRIGYGISEGPDVENSGACNNRRFQPAYLAAAKETIDVLSFASQLPYVNAEQGIVVGQSFGGATSIQLTAMPVRGLQGAVNFSGGGGGDPEKHPRKPCSAEQMTKLFYEVGKHATVPTLWLYSENDQFFGTEWPRQWMDAYLLAGGRGRFILLPPYKDNGHDIFTGNPSAWQADFESFIRQLGFLK